MLHACDGDGDEEYLRGIIQIRWILDKCKLKKKETLKI